MTDCFTR